MARVFLDTNYFIDIAQRNPGVGKAVDGQEIVISSLSVHILAYINKINIPNVALTRLVNQVQVVDFDKKVLNLALRGPTKDLEDNIQKSRRYYNGAVRDFNSMIVIFPTNIIAQVLGFKAEPFFEASDEEKKNVEIKF